MGQSTMSEGLAELAELVATRSHPISHVAIFGLRTTCFILSFDLQPWIFPEKTHIICLPLEMSSIKMKQAKVGRIANKNPGFSI